LKKLYALFLGKKARDFSKRKKVNLEFEK